jgi:hypothetical protein
MTENRKFTILLVKPASVSDADFQAAIASKLSRVYPTPENAPLPSEVLSDEHPVIEVARAPTYMFRVESQSKGFTWVQRVTECFDERQDIITHVFEHTVDIMVGNAPSSIE